MSSLSDQLSALANPIKGFAHSSSSTPLGRGFHHSSRHGHSLHSDAAESGVKRKPSVLFDNAREAADVPSEVLRDNAARAWEVLRTAVDDAHDPHRHRHDDNDAERYRDIEHLWSTHSSNFERGTATPSQNERVDRAIAQLFKFLTTMALQCPPNDNDNDNNNDNNPILTSTLHIVEYLLRRYDVHARPPTSHRLLTTFLPLHLSHPALFSRVLSLIDLTHCPPWTRLTPYAARDGPPLARTALAKFAARDEATFGRLAEMADEAYGVWKEECPSDGGRR